MSRAVLVERKNHLTDGFYTAPEQARATMTAKQLQQTLLYHSDARVMACGRTWDIKTKSLGAGIYLVWLEARS